MGKGRQGILIEAVTLFICEPFQEIIFEAGNSTYALEGLLYLDTTCHFARWEGTCLWSLLGQIKKSLNIFDSFSCMHGLPLNQPRRFTYPVVCLSPLLDYKPLKACKSWSLFD